MKRAVEMEHFKKEMLELEIEREKLKLRMIDAEDVLAKLDRFEHGVGYLYVKKLDDIDRTEGCGC